MDLTLQMERNETRKLTFNKVLTEKKEQLCERLANEAEKNYKTKRE